MMRGSGIPKECLKELTGGRFSSRTLAIPCPKVFSVIGVWLLSSEFPNEADSSKELLMAGMFTLMQCVSPIPVSSWG